MAEERERQRDDMISRIDERLTSMRERLEADLPRISEALDRLTRFAGRLDHIDRDIELIRERMREYEKERDQEMELVTRLQTEHIAPLKSDIREASIIAKTRWKILAALVGFGGSIVGALIVLLFEHLLSKILP